MEQLNDVNLYERPELADLTEAVAVIDAISVSIAGSINIII